jgi:hypothetical protein
LIHRLNLTSRAIPLRQQLKSSVDGRLPDCPVTQLLLCRIALPLICAFPDAELIKHQFALRGGAQAFSRNKIAEYLFFRIFHSAYLNLNIII